jgi:hypothetical protein
MKSGYYEYADDGKVRVSVTGDDGKVYKSCWGSDRNAKEAEAIELAERHCDIWKLPAHLRPSDTNYNQEHATAERGHGKGYNPVPRAAGRVTQSGWGTEMLSGCLVTGAVIVGIVIVGGLLLGLFG